ncbi:MAG TPA: DNA-deoxyinosine glycosylase, partial [Bacteroidetes bacterium]|nr:DNA-deoxyinosine glycosylase [Bacteroidota bacterium]HEX04725.1 DNA-deoxyinosine glycosylase [Bacteroidota bacterium]
MTRLEGFPCVAASGGSVLILGSMPSQRSLEAKQYYAHPRNAFWSIMGELFGAGSDKPYGERLKILTANQIVLWDVLMSCQRTGSLDALIDDSSIAVNDFAGLFLNYSEIRNVFLNGRKAAALFQRRVLPDLSQSDQLSCYTLPSTSPAYAAMPFDQKLEHWRAILK